MNSIFFSANNSFTFAARGTQKFPDAFLKTILNFTKHKRLNVLSLFNYNFNLRWVIFRDSASLWLFIIHTSERETLTYCLDLK